MAVKKYTFKVVVTVDSPNKWDKENVRDMLTDAISGINEFPVNYGDDEADVEAEVLS